MFIIYLIYAEYKADKGAVRALLLKQEASKAPAKNEGLDDFIYPTTRHSPVIHKCGMSINRAEQIRKEPTVYGAFYFSC